MHLSMRKGKNNMEDLDLFLISPKGSEDKSSIVVADNVNSAKEKALSHPEILEAYEAGVNVSILNMSHQLRKMGYNIDISKMGIYH